MIIDLPEETLSTLNNQLDPIDDGLAIEYLNLITTMGKQTLSDAEIPKSYLPNRVQRVLRPYLKSLGYRFGCSNKGGENLWGFKRIYAFKVVQI
ncbi:conserved hypothetical protein [Vibrio crassostreae]|nr:conserved hypothetical protein [Vibrio crassostreae]CAK1905542.1 conserved hypothetical protein [Vibrio crassostreae]CAK1934324.1 conserved hypothetical protein [Vibrio crassostreae]CAK2301021.1 conserved hypothetical protein [Vibrio crassostreae]CAK2769029.1 conserved hypothetical protein [Vibrio crassostreae]